MRIRETRYLHNDTVKREIGAYPWFRMPEQQERHPVIRDTLIQV